MHKDVLICLLVVQVFWLRLARPLHSLIYASLPLFCLRLEGRNYGDGTRAGPYDIPASYWLPIFCL